MWANATTGFTIVCNLEVKKNINKRINGKTETLHIGKIHFWLSAYLYRVSLCTFLTSHLPDLPSANISSCCSLLTFQKQSCNYNSQTWPCYSLWPCYPWLCGKHHPTPVPRVQPESLLEDLGRQHGDSAHAPIPQRLLRALRWKQHVPGGHGPPQIPCTRAH